MSPEGSKLCGWCGKIHDAPGTCENGPFGSKAWKTPEASADCSPARGSVARFSREEIIEGLRELYEEWCELKADADRCDKVRLPDYEAALDQLEREGMPAPLNDGAMPRRQAK